MTAVLVAAGALVCAAGAGLVGWFSHVGRRRRTPLFISPRSLRDLDERIRTEKSRPPDPTVDPDRNTRTAFQTDQFRNEVQP